MTLQQLYLVLLAGGLVLLASIVATRAATTVGLPALLLFLGVGVIVGEDGLGLQFENYLLADHLGTVALAIILIEGGLTTKFSDVRRVLAPAGMLATLGVAVSMAISSSCAMDRSERELAHAAVAMLRDGMLPDLFHRWRRQGTRSSVGIPLAT